MAFPCGGVPVHLSQLQRRQVSHRFVIQAGFHVAISRGTRRIVWSSHCVIGMCMMGNWVWIHVDVESATEENPAGWYGVTDSEETSQ